MTNMMAVDTLLGRLIIGESQGAITHLNFPGDPLPQDGIWQETTILAEASRQLQEYLHGERRIFDLPLAPPGTRFQLQVWGALQQIPYGKTCSYQDIAIRVGNPRACRAVGQANHRNPIPIIIPCHRVIGIGGNLVGYGGGLPFKKRLLDLENCRYVKA